MTIKERYEKVLRWFDENNAPDQPELVYFNEFSLLVAVMLSAQCTDKRVNMVTPALMKAYPTPKAMAEAEEVDIFEYIRTVSYPNAKAHHLKGMAQRLVARFQGQVPTEREELESLPGVGRKTANVVMAVCFGKPTMAVDTHVFRVANRIGLTNNSKNVRDTEEILMKHIPHNLISRAHHWLILHGRYVCLARKPKCEICGLKEWCEHYTRL